MRSLIVKLIFLGATFFLLFLIIVSFLNPKRFGEVPVTPPGSEKTAEDISFKTLDDSSLNEFKSYSRGLEASGGTIIKNAEEWKLYFEFLGGDITQSVPNVADFSKEELIVVSGGLKATSGYSVEIESVQKGEKQIIVNVKETEPGESCEVTAGVATPADFVVIKKTSLPVEFNFVSQVNKCE